MLEFYGYINQDEFDAIEVHAKANEIFLLRENIDRMIH
jgi:hypothetical protein